MSIHLQRAFLFIVLATSLSMLGCKKKVVPVSSTPDSAAANKEELDPRVDVKEIDFQYFKAKAKINYTDAVVNQSANVDLRMQRDSIIWLSISKLGIEGARVMLTRDSAYVIDKINNTYEVYDFKTLGKKFNFNLSFDILQAAIVGNLPVAKDRKDRFKVMKDKDYYLLRQRQDSILIDNYVSIDNFKLKKASFLEPATNNSLTLDYENFALINDVLFPFNSNISLQYQSAKGTYQTMLTIQYTKADMMDKELKFPFNPPARKNDKK
jgi:hypothetical protein